jgi:hypothetical protein
MFGTFRKSILTEIRKSTFSFEELEKLRVDRLEPIEVGYRGDLDVFVLL